jgi:cytochrome c biogenesis protein CcmG, thiol:disulfide interchange protein DsbE
VGSRRLPLPWILVATALALVAAGMVVLALGGGDPDDDGTATEVPLTPQGAVPESVQAVALGSIDGGPDQTLGDLLGDRPVVVNFFASWCQPCLEEMPVFERVHQELGDQVRFVGLAVNDTPDRAREIVADTGVTYPTYTDTEGAALTFFEGLAMPTTVFLGADGEVLEVHSRELSEDQLRDRIREHFAVEG